MSENLSGAGAWGSAARCALRCDRGDRGCRGTFGCAATGSRVRLELAVGCNVRVAAGRAMTMRSTVDSTGARRWAGATSAPLRGGCCSEPT